MAVIFGICFASSIFLWRILSSKLNCLPPGPWGLPLIGHLHMLRGMPPYKALESLSRKYGPIMSLRLGMIPAVVISSKDLAREFFNTHDANFSDRPYMIIGDPRYGFVSLATSSYIGRHWKNISKLYTRMLFTAKCIDSFSWVRSDELSHVVDFVLKSRNIAVDVRVLSSTFLFNIMSRILMSKRYFGHGGADSGVDEDAVEFKQVTQEVMSLILKPCVSNFVPSYLRWLDWQIPRYKQVRAKQDKFMQKVVDEHKKTTRESKDLVDMALEFFRGNAQAELYTKASLLETLLGGTETTGVTCEWIMAAVMHNPQVLTNLQEELQRVVGSTRMVRESDISKLEYLQAVIKETFRRYPPATLLMPRTAHKATTIGGYHIPKGTTLLVNSWAIGMDPAVWEDPTQFLPERFLGISIDIKGHDFELIPFGSGRRKCPGMALGLRAVELLVANLIHGFHWSFVPGMTLSMEDECHSVSQLKIPLQAIAVPRLPKEVYANYLE